MSKFRVLTLTALLLVGACVSEEDDVDGATLYANNCSSCHGVDLSGEVGASLVAGTEAGDKTDAQWGDAIRSGIGAMPAFRGLSDAEVDAVIAHVRQLQGE